MADFNIYQGVIDFDDGGDGFSETYWMAGATPSICVTQLQAIVDARVAMLNDSISVIYAHVSKLGPERQSFIVGSNEVPGSDTVGTYKCNEPENAILVRQQTVGGKIANRYVHGVPDDAVDNRVYDPAAVAAWNTLLTALCTVIRTNTGYLNKVTPADRSTWTVDSWNVVQSRGFTLHKVGRPFGARRGRRRTA